MVNQHVGNHVLESSGVDGFDLGPLVQGQTSIAKPKRACSTLQLKRHSQLIQNLFTGTDCFFPFKITLVTLTWSFQENFSSGVVAFDLGPLLQGQTRIGDRKSAYNLLIIGPRGLG